MSETILNKTPAKSADLGEETLMNVYYGDELERYKAIADITTDRLSEICAAERDGRLVVLPCKVGDTVYRIISYKCNAVCNKLNACNSFKYKACKQAEFYVCPGTFQLNDMWWIGKTVFLTRAEAEAALKGAEHDD
jgi:hypothetical protein